MHAYELILSYHVDVTVDENDTKTRDRSHAPWIRVGLRTIPLLR